MRLRTKESLKPWTPNPIPSFAPYISKYKMQSRLTEQPIEETIMEMNAAGIKQGVLVAEGDQNSNIALNDICSSYPQFKALIGLDFSSGMHAVVQQITDCVRMGDNFVGVNLNPFMVKLPIDHHKFYGVYSLCQLYEIAAVVHSSMHLDNLSYWLEYETPRQIDRVCTDFPALKFVATHAMNPHWDLALALAQRHPNLYLEVSSLIPAYIPERFLLAMQKYLKNKFIWGSNYPLLPFDSIEKFKEKIDPSHHEVLFKNNAERVIFPSISSSDEFRGWCCQDCGVPLTVSNSACPISVHCVDCRKKHSGIN